MFALIPVGDVNPRERLPLVNYGLIAANIAVFVWMASLPEGRIEEIVTGWSIVPSGWRVSTFFTSMFMHADVLHLGGNMLFLWIAGDNVEDRLGKPLYLLFYLAAGVSAGAVHILTVTPASMDVPTLGASGAISGVLGAYVILFPTARIRFLYWIIYVVGFVTLRSWVAIGAWFGLQLLDAVVMDPELGGGVAYWAHIGGFAFGAGVIFLLALFRVVKGGVRASRREEWGP